MRRRITSAIVGVTGFVLLALGIPLAIVAQRQILDSEVVELQATAAETLPEISIPLDTTELGEIAAEPDEPPPFAVYDTNSTLVFGNGPTNPEPAVIAALTGKPSSSTDGLIVVATPITDRNETIIGVLRLSESLSGAQRRTRQAWLVMTLAGAIALGVAWLIATGLARRLSQPVIELAESASRLGHGGLLPAHPPTGITELDQLGDALTRSSEQINDAMGRERRFSADVSHQLRTPLAGLRLKLEAAAERDPDATYPASALADLDRLEATVSHLLTLARGTTPTATTSSTHAALQSAQERHGTRAARLSRTIDIASEFGTTVLAASASIDQILDVLIDNALNHGTGDITLATRDIPGGTAIDVSNEGTLIADETLFARGNGTNHGIGLALARSIAEAEGGRLVLTHTNPTTFSLILLNPP